MKRYSTLTSSSLSSICNKSASDRICILSVVRFVWLLISLKAGYRFPVIMVILVPLFCYLLVNHKSSLCPTLQCVNSNQLMVYDLFIHMPLSSSS